MLLVADANRMISSFLYFICKLDKKMTVNVVVNQNLFETIVILIYD